MSDKANVQVLEALSISYLEPTPEIASVLKSLPANHTLSDEIAASIEILKSEFEKSDQRDLLIDYAKLFVGPFGLLASPFGSVYLEPENQLLGYSTMEVRRLYNEAGLNMSEDFKNPPDHISAELEFASYLFFRELNADTKEEAENFKRLRMEFFIKHLGAWAGRLARNVEENAATGFYRELGNLTRIVIKEELSKIKIESTAKEK